MMNQEDLEVLLRKKFSEGDDETIELVISIMKEQGYKITNPPRVVKDEYTFQKAWDLYQKKVGRKDMLEKKWNSMSLKDRKAATEYIPAYVLSKPNKQYRKNFQTFLNQRGWEDEIINENDSTPTPQQQSEISKLIEENKQKQESYTKEAKQEALRKRILGYINLVKENPNSLCMDSLKYYHKTGLLQKLNIDWKP